MEEKGNEARKERKTEKKDRVENDKKKHKIRNEKTNGRKGK